MGFIALLLLVAVLLEPAWAHHDAPMCRSGPPPEPKPIIWPAAKRTAPAQWTWRHWWEANKYRYLYRARQGEKQETSEEARQEARDKALETLREALKDDHPGPRTEAALALGRMEATDAVEDLKRLAGEDSHVAARRNAILGLALIGDRRSEAALQGLNYPTLRLRQAGLAGMGMIREPAAATRAGLRRALGRGTRRDNPAVATVASWSLTQGGAGEEPKRFLDILQNRRSPWLASDALLALGSARDPQSLRVLRHVAMSTSAAQQLPSFQLLIDVDHAKHRSRGENINRDGGLATAWSDYVEAHRRLRRYSPNAIDRPDDEGPEGKGTFVLGIERTYIARLRASAAIALGSRRDPKAGRTLVQVLEQEPRSIFSWSRQFKWDGAAKSEFARLPKSFAAVGLGRMGHRPGLPKLLEMVSRQTARGRRKTLEALESPLRGFAAIGLGLYARARETPQGTQNNPGYEKAIEVLRQRVTDSDETASLRAASALALGLAGRSEALPALVQASGNLGRRDSSLLPGYFILGRGMLGDQQIIDPAARLLDQHLEGTKDTAALHSARAAVLGLGILDNEQAIPAMLHGWQPGQHYFVSREMILALALCEARNVAPLLRDRISNSDDPRVRAYMAGALGELFAVRRPGPLSGFLVQRNFTFPNEQQSYFQGLVNEFMVYRMLPELRDAKSVGGSG